MMAGLTLNPKKNFLTLLSDTMRYQPDDCIINPEDEFSTFSVVTGLGMTAQVMVLVS